MPKTMKDLIREDWHSAPTGRRMAGYGQPFGVMNVGQGQLIAGCFGDTKDGHDGAELHAKLIAAAPKLARLLDALAGDRADAQHHEDAEALLRELGVRP